MIIVKTQLGAGGNWHTEARLNTGPRNLLKAARIARDAVKSNSGTGGYRTLITVNDKVLPSDLPGWPFSLEDARKALDDLDPQPVETVTCNTAHACTEYRVHVYADGSAKIQSRGQTSNRFVTRATLSAVEWIALDASLDYEGAYINNPAPLARACELDD